MTRKIFEKFGLEIQRKENSNPLRQLFLRLKSAGIGLEYIYDIGAFRGEWTREVAKYSPKSTFILFEPNSFHENYLKEVTKNYHLVLLGKTNRKVKFYSHNGTGDSIYPEFDESGEVRKEFRWEKMSTLDSYISRKGLPLPSMIKLDVQGAEIDILNGSREVLKTTKVVLLECPIVHYNWGSPSILEYLEFMYRENFVPYFVTELHRLGEVLVQIDIAFIHKDTFQERIGDLSQLGFWESNQRRASMDFENKKS